MARKEISKIMSKHNEDLFQEYDLGMKELKAAKLQYPDNVYK